MNKLSTDDLRIAQIQHVINPNEIYLEIPISEKAADITLNTRESIKNILNGSDDRLLVVSGPCSIHDPTAALDYANRLLKVKHNLEKELLIVMRVYFEKPRTTVGWKGLINDPDLNNSFDINKGLRVARKLLLSLNELGMPAASEYLDVITPQYIADLISWGAIGARTTESQVHREMTSGLSCPVGLKNGTNGNLDIAVDGIRAACHPHHFLSLTKDGHSAIFTTTGNHDCHIILRGGREPNYDAEHVDLTCSKLEAAGLRPHVMIDFSHANSQKNPENQALVAESVAGQISKGDKRIIGVMIESHLVSGRQDVKNGIAEQYGQSITDACINFEQTEHILDKLADAVTKRRGKANTP